MDFLTRFLQIYGGLTWISSQDSYQTNSWPTDMDFLTGFFQNRQLDNDFALYPGPATYEYIMSFLGFLLPVMKHELKTFKMACGKQLGEELVVEVIVSEAHKLGPTESNEAAAGMFPVKFKSVQYGLQKHQHVEEQQPKECSIVENQNGKRKTEIKCTQSEKRKGKQVSFPSVGAQDSKAMEKGKRKTGLPILNKEGTHPCIVEETEGDCKSET
ncbi:uncharacterized protein LOC121779498 isoform X2 [Salvia splendens]|uniref:uncharacterized protein LOC121779498 isoform X2 n=1 Tax=Salvia splendens TaxID=180675 RepID=UPI001C27548B|nr:uncharacterized protein LOC121779498 isoform X2 [Salvia splendens]XP_042032766.1 uncharacterized protein LOC121779498 isoform X2 [Salvia splendens]XP_042032767.1 uncharacterized protein LOC121779498 isoform X2 [Salvia splendens]XP_042032768.1 uncharacterized protein LOC121779498 isoform X2 [Salvia splendens]XP_042032769.1 uncharacterized protein LOC121779498 isoform X2 [Salvia splendens]